MPSGQEMNRSVINQCVGHSFYETCLSCDLMKKTPFPVRVYIHDRGIPARILARDHMASQSMEGSASSSADDDKVAAIQNIRDQILPNALFATGMNLAQRFDQTSCLQFEHQRALLVSKWPI